MHTRLYKRCLHPCPIHPTFIHWCSPLLVDISRHPCQSIRPPATTLRRFAVEEMFLFTSPYKYRSLERTDTNGRALPLSFRCRPPSASPVREGSRITRNTPPKDETTCAIYRYSLGMCLCIITLFHGLYGHRPGCWKAQRSVGKEVRCNHIISSGCMAANWEGGVVDT